MRVKCFVSQNTDYSFKVLAERPDESSFTPKALPSIPRWGQWGTSYTAKYCMNFVSSGNFSTTTTVMATATICILVSSFVTRPLVLVVCSTILDVSSFSSLMSLLSSIRTWEGAPDWRAERARLCIMSSSFLYSSDFIHLKHG